MHTPTVGRRTDNALRTAGIIMILSSQSWIRNVICTESSSDGSRGSNDDYLTRSRVNRDEGGRKRRRSDGVLIKTKTYHEEEYQEQEGRELVVGGTVVQNPGNVASFYVQAGIDEEDPNVPRYMCGGTVIHDDIVITAAHCFGSFHAGVLVYDETSDDFSRPVPVDYQIWPVNFDLRGDITATNNDIMVLRLTENIVETSNYTITPIPINTDDDIPTTKQHLEVFGLGQTGTRAISERLRRGTFSYVPNDVCYDILSRFRRAPTVNDDVLCANTINGTSSICAGDSGGPLTYTDDDEINGRRQTTLVGVASFSDLCRPNSIPDGFTKVSFFASWIQDQICQLSNFPPITCQMNPLKVSSSSSSSSIMTASSSGPEEAIMVQILFAHDYFPEHSRFIVRDMNDVVRYAGPNYVARRESVWRSMLYLQPGNYKFEVYDKLWDGLYGSGYENATVAGGWKIVAVYNNEKEGNDDGSGLVSNDTYIMEMTREQFAAKKYSSNELLLASGGPAFGSSMVQDFVVPKHKVVSQPQMESTLTVFLRGSGR